MFRNFNFSELELIKQKISILLAGVKGIKYALVMESKLTAMLIKHQVNLCECVGIYQSRHEANIGMANNPPELLVLSSRIKGGSVNEVLEDILELKPMVKTLVFVANQDLSNNYGKFNGVVAEKDLGDLDRPGINALKAAISSTYYRSKSILACHSSSNDENINFELSANEVKILRLMDLGMNNSQIASELGIKYGTLKKYCNTIYAKLGTNNRHLAIKLGLSTPITQQTACQPSKVG